MTEVTEARLNEAYDQATRGQPMDYPCREHGHFDCATSPGGSCTAERASRMLNPEARYRICTVCGTPIKADERGDVLDSSGRCDQCAP